MSLYREKAVVLRTYKFGEADRIVVMLCENSGKVRAVATGVRKTASKIGARLEPFGHVDVQLYRGRELDTVRQVELVDTYFNVRNDFDRMAQAMSMVEAIDKLTPDREPVPELYVMLHRALSALNAHNSPLLLGAFYWKVLALEGGAPLVDSCVRCGESDELCAFDMQEGGALCRACRSGTPISNEALDILRLVLHGGLADALNLSESSAVHEVNLLAQRAMESHLERRLRSIGVLDRHL